MLFSFYLPHHFRFSHSLPFPSLSPTLTFLLFPLPHHSSVFSPSHPLSFPILLFLLPCQPMNNYFPFIFSFSLPFFYPFLFFPIFAPSQITSHSLIFLTFLISSFLFFFLMSPLLSFTLLFLIYLPLLFFYSSFSFHFWHSSPLHMIPSLPFTCFLLAFLPFLLFITTSFTAFPSFIVSFSFSHFPSSFLILPYFLSYLFSFSPFLLRLFFRVSYQSPLTF